MPLGRPPVPHEDIQIDKMKSRRLILMLQHVTSPYKVFLQSSDDIIHAYILQTVQASWHLRVRILKPFETGILGHGYRRQRMDWDSPHQ